MNDSIVPPMQPPMQSPVQEAAPSPVLPQGQNQGQPALVCDGDLKNFKDVVVGASMQVPVVVDFWADWCAPCKQLMPLLEKHVLAQAGAVRLVKINADQNQDICGQLRIQSLPTVMVFWQGQPIDGFQGAIPESQVIAFIEKIIATAGAAAPADPGDMSAQIVAALDQAEALMAEGEAMQAMQIYQQVVHAAPDNIRAIIGAAEATVKLGEVERAEQLLAGLEPTATQDSKDLSERVTRLQTQIELMKSAEGAGDVAELQSLVEAEPLNHQARYDLAIAHQAAGDMKACAEALLGIIMREREWNDDAARQLLFKLFEAAGPTDPFTLKYRRRLSSVLFS